MRSKFNPMFVLYFSITLLALSPIPATAADLKQVLILPFTINAEKDLAYLNRGMVAMLSSRLYRQDQITTLTGNKPSATLADALKSGNDSGADFVVFGSITVFGKSVSTDLKLVNVEDATTDIMFSRAGNKQGDVISHIDQFAAQANARLQSAGQAVAAQTATAVPVPVVVAAPSTSPPAATPPTPAPTAASAQPEKVWRSNRLKGEIRSMAAGDVDDDGQIEIAMIVGQDITVRRYEKERLTTIGEIKGPGHAKLLGIDVADINANGKAEIYVTRLNKQGQLASSVLEWSGSRFDTILEKAAWYFRVIDIPGRGHVLMGQKRPQVGSAGGGDFEVPGSAKLFIPGVFELVWQGGQITAGERQPLPREINIFGFAYGNVIEPDKPMIVTLTEENRLRVVNAAGKRQWTGDGRFGGSTLYMEYPTADDQNATDRYYLLQRILVADLNKDGQPEVVATKNKDVVLDLFKRFRSYSAGQVVCLGWEKVTMKTRWKTETISGYVSDVALADLNRDNRPDLIYTVVSGEGGMLEKPVSYVVIQWGVS